MADDMLENETVQTAATAVAAAGAVAFAATGLMDTNVLVDTAGLAGTHLDAAYGAIGAAGALRGWDLVGDYTDG